MLEHFAAQSVNTVNVAHFTVPGLTQHMYMLHNTYLLCQSLAFSSSTSTNAQFHIKLQIEWVHEFLVKYINAQKQSGTGFFSLHFFHKNDLII